MIKRRHFLKFAGSTLAAMGLSQFDFLSRAERYSRVLAQSTPRKLALLVGINEYQSPWGSLHGCLTDVQLQRELLVHQFGFKAEDVVTLTNVEATRDGILQAFEEHLIKQVRDDDVVVIHFSGHGDLVKDPDPISQSGCNGSLVPFDEQPSSSSTVSYIMGRTIFLLMTALKTKNVTFMMDSCFSGAGTRGNLQIRSIGSSSCAEPSLEELEYQNRWLSELKLSPEEFKQRRQIGTAKGTVLAATQPRQLAFDLPFDDGSFHAGLFTYLTTQYLWEQTGNSSFEKTVFNVSDRMQEFFDQQPLLDANPPNNKQARFYFTDKQTAPAEAVITNVTGNQVDLWLGGIRPESLAAFQDGAVLSVADNSVSQKVRVQIELRNGLIARGQVLDVNPSSLASGTVLQEQIRQLPKPGEIDLRIGLDESLGVDISQAERALRQIERIEVLPLQQGEIDYILGRMTKPYHNELLAKQISDLPPVGSIGLFSAGLTPVLVGETFGRPGEATVVAIERLKHTFDKLLALHILRTALNASSSQLNVEASILSNGQPVGQLVYRTRMLSQTSDSSEFYRARSGTYISFEITNRENQPFHLVILAITPLGNIITLCPVDWENLETSNLLNPSETLIFPRKEDGIELRLGGTGEIEFFAIVSSENPINTLRMLSSSARQRGISRGFIDLGENLTNFIESFWSELNGDSGVEVSKFLALYTKVRSHA